MDDGCSRADLPRYGKRLTMTPTTPRPPRRPASDAPGASWRDRLRPAELLGLSAIVAAFIGAIVFMSTRTLEPTLIFAVLTFIITLVMFAMFALTASPRADEQLDIDGQNLSAKANPPKGDPPVSGTRGH